MKKCLVLWIGLWYVLIVFPALIFPGSASVTFEYSAFPIPVLTIDDSACPIPPAMQTVKKLKHFHLNKYEETIFDTLFFFNHLSNSQAPRL